MTEAAFIPSSKNSLDIERSENANDNVGPSITMAILCFDSTSWTVCWAVYSLTLNSSNEGEVRIITSISYWISLQLFPISIAVSYLSPVRTQMRIFVSIIFAIVSPTPSCSLSSIAEQPTKVKFYSSWSYRSFSLASLFSSVEVFSL
jgi:hypothetical protein